MQKVLFGMGMAISLFGSFSTVSAQTDSLFLKAEMDQRVTLDNTLPEIRADHKPATVNLARYKANKNLVLFFFSEQCGVTYFYKQRIQQIQKDFENKGFAFLGIRCGKKEKPDAPIEIAEVKYLKMPFVDDSAGDLAAYFHITQSVTFAVIDRAGKLRYQGGFDENVDAKHAQKPYLRNALRSVAYGKPVAVKAGHAIGCAILPIK